MRGLALALLCASAGLAFDISQAKTFSIGEVTVKSKTRALREERLLPVVRERVSARLIALGLTEVPGKGDVRVSASLTVDSDRRPEYRRRPRHLYDYRGRLLISIRAGQDNALVWQEFPSFSEDEAKELEERLHRHVDRVMAKFPPKGK